MAPQPISVPRLYLDGALAEDLGRDLESMVVHVADGHATAEVAVRGPLPVGLSVDAAQKPTSLVITLSPEDECFSGQIREAELRVRPDTGHRTGLFAARTSPDGAAKPLLPLILGQEVEWANVHRGLGSATAHAQTTLPSLRTSRRIALSTPEPISTATSRSLNSGTDSTPLGVSRWSSWPSHRVETARGSRRCLEATRRRRVATQTNVKGASPPIPPGASTQAQGCRNAMGPRVTGARRSPNLSTSGA